MTEEKTISFQKLRFLVLLFISLTFLFFIAIIFLDEFLDLPHLLFEAEITPVNFIEIAIESAIALIVYGIMMFLNLKIFDKVKRMQKIIPVCSYCKKVRTGEKWISIEKYISEHSDSLLSHGICPDCMKEHYPEIYSEIEKV